MSHQQIPVAAQQQSKAPATSSAPTAPLPINAELLRLISGGTDTAAGPIRTW
jgi:hypothetical protein